MGFLAQAMLLQDISTQGMGGHTLTTIERPKEQHGKLLEIMSTDQHPMRMQLGVDFLRNVDFANITSGSEVRAKYNSYVNKVFGLVGTLSDEKIVKDRK
jgi:hypothetical protein